MDKRQTGRWLKALEIAEILFEYEGYSSNYLEEIKDFILISREQRLSQRPQDNEQKKK